MLVVLYFALYASKTVVGEKNVVMNMVPLGVKGERTRVSRARARQVAKSAHRVSLPV